MNERIEELAQTFELKNAPLDLICECGDAQCVQPIAMTYSEYEALRADPHQFAVHTGHEIPDVEQVVERRKGYDIVAKNEGIPQRVAEQTDPRS